MSHKSVRERSWGLFVLLIVVKGLLFVLLIPAWQGPDETRNFAAVREWSSGKSADPPASSDDSSGDSMLRSLDTYDFWRLSEHTIPKSLVTIPTQSPFLASFLTLPGRVIAFGDIVSHLMFLRFLSFLLYLGVVWITFQLATQVDPDSHWTAFSAVGFVAFHPQYSFQSGIFSLDCYLVFFFSVILYILGRLPLMHRKGLAVGVLLLITGLSVMTKRIGVVAFPLCLVGLFLVALRCPTSASRSRQLIGGALLIGVGLGSGLVLLREPIWEMMYQLFEKEYLLGEWGQFLSYASRSIYLALFGAYGSPPDMSRIVRSLAIFYVSFWFSYGWMIYKLSYGWYVVLFGVAGWAMVGFGRTIVRRPVRAQFDSHVLSILFVALLMVVGSVVTAVVFHPLWSPNDAHGRYLFPVLVPISIFLAVGIRGGVPETCKDTASKFFILFVLMLNLVCVVKYLIPIFYL